MEIATINKIQTLKNEGNNLFKLNKFEDAITQYNIALDVIIKYHQQNSNNDNDNDNNKVQIICNRALCYLRLKQFDNAIADCTKALKIQPKCVKALYRRARSYELKNNLEEACIDISKAKMLNPKNSEVEQMYKKVITQRKTKEILEAPSSQKRISTVLRNCLSQVKPSCTIAMGTVYKIKAIEHEHDDNNNNDNNNKINMVLPQIHIDTIQMEKIVNILLTKQDDIVQKIKDMTESLTCLPIQFQTKEEQINFYAVKALCNFGEYEFGKDIEKHLKCTFNEMQIRGLMTMHLGSNEVTATSSRGWDAKFLLKIDMNHLCSYFNLPITQEERLKTGIYIGKDTIFKPYLKKMKDILHMCGTILQDAGYVDFADFIHKMYQNYQHNENNNNDNSNNNGNITLNAFFVQRLAETFSPFCDQYLLTSKHGRSQIKVGFYRNAQLFTRDLFLNVHIFETDDFLVQNNERSLEVQLSTLTCLADLKILAILRKLKVVLIFDPDILKDLDLFERIVDRNYILLKAACVLSVDKIAFKLNENGFALSVWQVDLLFRDLNFLTEKIFL